VSIMHQEKKILYLKSKTWLFVGMFFLFCFPTQAANGTEKIMAYITAQTFLILGAMHEWAV
jgi:hypothetical protein